MKIKAKIETFTRCKPYGPNWLYRQIGDHSSGIEML